MKKLNANFNGLVIEVSAKGITLIFVKSKTPFKCRECKIDFENSKQLWSHTKLQQGLFSSISEESSLTSESVAGDSGGMP